MTNANYPVDTRTQEDAGSLLIRTHRIFLEGNSPRERTSSAYKSRHAAPTDIALLPYLTEESHDRVLAGHFIDVDHVRVPGQRKTRFPIDYRTTFGHTLLPFAHQLQGEAA